MLRMFTNSAYPFCLSDEERRPFRPFTKSSIRCETNRITISRVKLLRKDKAPGDLEGSASTLAVVLWCSFSEFANLKRFQEIPHASITGSGAASNVDELPERYALACVCKSA